MSKVTAMIQKSVNRFEADVRATQTGLAMMTGLAMCMTDDRNPRRVQRPARQIGIWSDRDRNNKHTLLKVLINYANNFSLFFRSSVYVCVKKYLEQKEIKLWRLKNQLTLVTFRARFFVFLLKPIYIVPRTQQNLNCLCAHSVNYDCVKNSE